MQRIISVDPGQKGGIALLSDGQAEVHLMPDSVSKIVDMIRNMNQPGTTMAVERSQPMPKQGVTSVFTYGQHFGIFEATAAALMIPYISIRPTEWKKALGLNSDKTSSIIEAERLFPSVDLVPNRCRKPSDGMAEALLIGEYARRKLGAV